MKIRRVVVAAAVVVVGLPLVVMLIVAHVRATGGLSLPPGRWPWPLRAMGGLAWLGGSR
ncbi:MAG TPA: hypothetical protein VK845_10105 [Gemmatimonadales bacterium]|nr:hypothetical protein [Gemmatimonadales bacterium]